MKRLRPLLLFAALLLGGCGGRDPIVVIQLHPTNPDILYIATNDGSIRVWSTTPALVAGN